MVANEIIEKTFIASTENVNAYGFRVLTDGIDIEDFRNNPIMLGDHWERIGKWTSIEKKDGKLYVSNPQFSRNAKGQEWKNDVQDGIINATSLGILIKETSKDPSLMLAGQTLPTVTKSKLIEVSLATIPANGEAVSLAIYEEKEDGGYKKLSMAEAQAKYKLDVQNASETQEQTQKTVAVQLSIQNEIDKKMEEELQKRLAEAEAEADRLKAEKLSIEQKLIESQKKMSEFEQTNKDKELKSLSWQKLEKEDPERLLSIYEENGEQSAQLVAKYLEEAFKI
jgi:hypothetical protein